MNSNNVANIIALLKFFFMLLLAILVVGGIRRFVDSLDKPQRKKKKSEYNRSQSQKAKTNHYEYRKSAYIPSNKVNSSIEKSKRKGVLGEFKVELELSHLSKEYKVINDLLIPYNNANLNYSQIDHVVISPYGIFVIEAKNFTGFIAGDEMGTWYQDNRPIKNPLKQNGGHIDALRKLLVLQGYNNLTFHNIVTLNARCDLTEVTATSVVQDIRLQNLIEKQSRKRVLSTEAVEEIYHILDRLNIRDPLIRERHIQQIKEIKNSEDSHCVICGRKVTIGVRDYCLNHPNRFKGKVYCMEHQG